MEDLEILKESVCEVDAYTILPKDVTDGTAMHYCKEFPNLPEEMYYLLQCATKHDLPEKTVIETCQEILDERNEQLLNSLEGRTNPTEFLLDETILEDYNGDDAPAILKQRPSDDESKQHSE